MMGGEIGCGGKRDGAISTRLERYRSIEGTRGKGSRGRTRMEVKQTLEYQNRLRVVTARGREEKAVILEGNGAAARTIEIDEEPPTAKGTGGDTKDLAAAGDAPISSRREGISCASAQSGGSGGEVTGGE